MLRIIDFVHHVILENVKDGTLVDMTAGNGYDTEFLINNYKNSKIYAFDTQIEAIEATRKRVGNSANLIHDCHSNVLDYVTNADLILFNLGYLPQSDSKVVTKPKTTIKAIKESLKILNKAGLIIIVVYTGHDSGKTESTEIKFLLEGLCNQYDVYEYKLINKVNAPYVHIIKKTT